MTVANALARFPLKTEAAVRAERASKSEGNALQAAVEWSRDLTALIERGQALAKVGTMPETVRDSIVLRADMLDDVAHDANPELAVERYEADAPRRERAAVDYAREVARDLRKGE